MSDEIFLDISEFQSNIGNLKKSVENLTTKTTKCDGYQITNIDPFKKDLEQFIEALALVDKYKSMLTEDVEGFEDVGEGLRNQDDSLSDMQNQIFNGNVPSKA